MTNSNLLKKFLGGTPVELTESSQEVVSILDTLNDDCVFQFEGEEYDVQGDVFWMDDRSAVVYVPNWRRD